MEETKKLSIYSALARARADIATQEVKKTGKNQQFNYLELEDFLPQALIVLKDYDLCPVFSFDIQTARVVVYNSLGETVECSMPTVFARLPNSSNPIQEMGSTSTYLKRYLLANLLMVSEHDSVDCLTEEDFNGANPSVYTQQQNQVYVQPQYQQQQAVQQYAPQYVQPAQPVNNIAYALDYVIKEGTFSTHTIRTCLQQMLGQVPDTDKPAQAINILATLGASFGSDQEGVSHITTLINAVRSNNPVWNQ